MGHAIFVFPIVMVILFDDVNQRHSFKSTLSSYPYRLGSGIISLRFSKM